MCVAHSSFVRSPPRSRTASFFWVVVLLTLATLGEAASLTKLWEIPADGSRDYITASATERGIALNPLTDHVLVSSRAVGTTVAVLQAASGVEVGFLNVDGIAGGSFALGCLGVDDSGRIYGVNISGLPTTPASVRIYRWDTEASAPRVLFSGPPVPGVNGRWGESFAIRGGGASVQILLGGGTGTTVGLFRYSDASQNALSVLLVEAPTAASGDFSRAITFGNGDELLAQGPDGSQLKRFTYKPAASGSVTATFASSANVGKGLASVSFNAATHQLAVLDAVQREVRIYDAPAFDNLILQGVTSFPEPSTANPGTLGQVALSGNRVAAINTQNGVVVAQVTASSTGARPTVQQNPSSQISFVGAPVSFVVTASGDAPLAYQWSLNGTNLPGATHRMLSIPAAENSDAGVYQVAVSNAIGSTNSETALLILSDSVRSDVARRSWAVLPGSQPYFPPSLQRVSLAWNPVSKNLLFLGNPPVNALTVVNADSGAPLRSLTLAGELVGPGAFVLQSVGAAEDGAVFACTLTSDGTQSPLRIYRWANDTAGTLPQLVFSGDPGAGTSERWGDAMAVRNAGPQTEILLTSRGGSRFALLTASGNGFSVQPYSVDVPAGSLGQGVSFNGPRSFWAKAYNSPLLLVQWQTGNPVATVIRSVAGDDFRASVGAIGFMASKQWMVGQDFDDPEHVQIHDFGGVGSPTWIDTEFFLSSGKTGGPDGSVAIGVDRAFAVSTEAGLVAITMAPAVVERPTLQFAVFENALQFTWQGNFILQTSLDPEGPWTDVAGKQSGQSVPIHPNENRFFRLRQ